MTNLLSDKTNNVWCCTWNENSRRHRKYFSVRTFGFSEAKEKAIQMRLQKIRKDRHHRRKCNSSDEDASMSGLLSDNESSSLESNDSTNHKVRRGTDITTSMDVSLSIDVTYL